MPVTPSDFQPGALAGLQEPSTNRIGLGQSSVSVYAEEERTASPAAPEIVNAGYRGVEVVIEVTDDGDDSPSVVFAIEAVPGDGGTPYALLTSAAVTSATGSSPRVLRLYPGLAPANNLVVSDVLPPRFRITATHADADAITYSVRALMLP